MERKHYVIGVDFGTLSARSVLVDTDHGKEIAEGVSAYAHGVMDTSLPTGETLPPGWALQDPADYPAALSESLRKLFAASPVGPEEVAALGIDFTCSSLLAVDREGTPLCFMEKWKHEPHAYVKLWKHHAAEEDAVRMTLVARERNESWLRFYGGKISSEWTFPKILQMVREKPEIFDETFRFVEAGDWLTRILTGQESHGRTFAAYKALWNPETGFPSDEYFTAVHPKFHQIIGTRVSDHLNDLTEIAGRLNEKGSEITGLPVGLPLSPAIPDGHAGIPGLNVTSERKLLMIIGTSSCFYVNGKEYRAIDGIAGAVRDGILPGLYNYEAGQSATGDIFDWFVQTGVPEKYEAEARERKISVHQLLREKAAILRPGESGLLALDWLNGNRSPLADSDLTGCILGLTLRTKPEEIYRTWLESTAFGAKRIIDRLEESGLPIDTLLAGGGIPRKDELLMQIYADVLGKEIEIAGTAQAGARGAAVFAAVSSGIYDSIEEASAKIAPEPIKTYYPNPEAHFVYKKLYKEYVKLAQTLQAEDSPLKSVLKIAREVPQNTETLEK